MRFGRTRLVRAAAADDGAHHHQGRLGRLGAGERDRGIDRLQIVPVVHLDDLPAVSFEARPDVLGEGQLRGSLDGDVVIVVEVHQLAEAEVPGEGGGLRGHPLHEVAVADDGVGVVVDQVEAGPIEGRGKERFGDGHADAVREAGAQRPGGRLHPRGEPMFGMPGRAATPLPEGLKLVDGKAVAGEMKQGIEQHGAVAGAEDEPVAVRPPGVRRIELEMPGPEHVGHRGSPQRHPGMAGVGLLNAVDSEGADGRDGQVVEIPLAGRIRGECVSHFEHLLDRGQGSRESASLLAPPLSEGADAG